MNKDVLLIRSGQFHLAVPTERILEIVDLDDYHAQQKKDLDVGQQLISFTSKMEKGKTSQDEWIRQMLQQTGVTLNTPEERIVENAPKIKLKKTHRLAEFEKLKDEFRLWRNHILPVVHLNHVLDPNEERYICPFALVHQASDHEMVYLDVDHIFNIVHIDTSDLKPVYHLTCDQTHSDKLQIPSTDVLAFVLEDVLSEPLPN